MSFLAIDWVIVVLYFLTIFGIAWWSMKQKQRSTSDYFLAGRHIGWFVIGASIFASNIGAEHIVGLAGTAAKTGVVMGHYELHAWLVLVLGWVFVPFYMRSRVFTMPEFLELRFSPKARTFLSLITLLSYVVTKVCVNVYAGAVVFQTLLGIDFWTGALFILIFTGIYTILGGMRAVVYTETLQTIVLIIGSVTVTIAGLIKLGGWQNFHALAGSGHFNLFLPANHPEFPWPGMILAPPIVGLWYWCTDQYIVQRALAAKNETQARRGSIFAAVLKLLPFYIFILPGVMAFALAKTGQIDLASADQAFPTLVMTLIPTGLRGLVAGGLLAALMSSLAAVFNSSSTLFTIDFYKKLKPGTSEKKLVLVGRIATAVVAVSGVIWIPLMKSISSELYHYLQSVQSYIAPPIAAVFLLGIFIKRINSRGAMAALVSGFVIGMARLTAELFKNSLSGFMHWFASVNYLYFCVMLFAFSIAVLVVVSLLTERPSYEKIQGLTYGTTVAADKAASRASWKWVDVVFSLVVVAAVAFTLIYFTG
ncbi:MAG TPA: sodium:solute symporter [Candidatus Aminicenantes bacterium]|nr:sodium:solute symporter [Candidatus Aminicenantes bacterium]